MFGVAMKVTGAVALAGSVYVSTQEKNPVIEYSKVVLAKYEMSSMSRAIIYQTMKSSAPTSKNFPEYLRTIMQSSGDPSKDPWGKSYTFERKGNDCTLTSRGPDGKLNTEDDLKQSFTITPL